MERREFGGLLCGIATGLVMKDTVFTIRDAEYPAGLLPRSFGIRRIAGVRLFWPEEYPHLIAEEALRLWNRRD